MPPPRLYVSVSSLVWGLTLVDHFDNGSYVWYLKKTHLGMVFFKGRFYAVDQTFIAAQMIHAFGNLGGVPTTTRVVDTYMCLPHVAEGFLNTCVCLIYLFFLI